MATSMPGLCTVNRQCPRFLTAAPGRVGGSSHSHVKDLFGALVLPFLCLTLFIEIVHRILLKTKTKVNRKIFMVCGGLAAADQLWKLLPPAVQDGEGSWHSWAALREFLPCFPGIPIPSLSLVGSVRLYLSPAEWFGDRSRGSFSDLVFHVFTWSYMPCVFCISTSSVHVSDPSQHPTVQMQSLPLLGYFCHEFQMDLTHISLTTVSPKLHAAGLLKELYLLF